ncbi:ASCH domain-containing protein [Streptomyces sp. NPDC047990]|uniref:ASCH domain-containing protein n=1 Tax=Streptomyces sp. NPDC047990 TaxID=3365496 RepID=UPI00371F24BF
MWARVEGMRSYELGTADEMRTRLNRLALAGRKTASTGLLAVYAEEAEGVEYPGETLALLDRDGARAALIEVTGVTLTPFAEVTWEHVEAEGEGHASVEEWRAGHRRYWDRLGTPVDDDTMVVCVAFRLIEGSDSHGPDPTDPDPTGPDSVDLPA